MKTNLLIVSGVAMLLWAVSVLLGSPLIGHPIKFAFVLISYTLIMPFFYEKIDKKWLVTSIFLMFPLIPITTDLIAGRFLDTKGSWLSSLSYFIGIGFGYIIYRTKNKNTKILMYCFTLFLSVFIMLIGYQWWYSKINYGNISGKINKNVPEFTFYDSYDNSYTKETFQNKTVILEFWFNQCPPCIKELPKYDFLFRKYTNKNVLFYSVNVLNKGDSISFTKKIMNKYHFQVPLIFTSKDSIKDFEITHYPTYIVIENNSMTYKGNLKGLSNKIKSSNLKN